MIFNFELGRIMKKNLKGYLLVVLLSTLSILFYMAVKENKDVINENINNIPNAFLNFFDIDTNTFTTVAGYYASIFKILSLFTSIYSLMLGLEIATYDRKNNVKDFLYAKPIKRSNIINIRILGALIYLFSLTLIIYLVSFILYKILGYDFKQNTIFLIDFSLFLLMSVFFSLGLVIGGFISVKKNKFIISLLTLIPFVTIHLIDSIFNIKFLWYINPFSYFKVSKIVSEGYQYNTIIITVFILVFLLSFGIAIYENNLKNENKIANIDNQKEVQ